MSLEPGTNVRYFGDYEIPRKSWAAVAWAWFTSCTAGQPQPARGPQAKWAEAVLRECLAIREKSQPDEWTTFNTRSLLGGSLLGQKKYAEAEPLIVSGYEGMKAREAKIPSPGRPRFTEGAERVVKLYEDWGKKEKAAEWRTRLAKPTDGTRNDP